MLKLKMFRPQDRHIFYHPYVFYVSQKDDIIYQESIKHHCHEVLLRWMYLERTKRREKEPYCFRSPGESFIDPTIKMIWMCERLAPTLFAKAVAKYVHPIEIAAGLEPTKITRVDECRHTVLLEADSKWSSNSLSMSIWMVLMRATLTFREGEKTWEQYVFADSYFRKLGTASRLSKVWDILPTLIAHKFNNWCGNSYWTSDCGVYSQIHTGLSENELGKWMWKHCWKDGNE